MVRSLLLLVLFAGFATAAEPGTIRFPKDPHVLDA